MSVQHTHNNTSFIQKQFPIVIICDGLESPANIGALFRVAEAFGVSEIVFCNCLVDLSSNRLKRTARHTQLKIPFSESNDILSEVNKFKERDFKIVVLEITNNSIPLNELGIEPNQNIALVIGNERYGVSKSVLETFSNTIAHIDMYGENSSMNVIQATSIALFSISNKLK